MAHLAKVTGRRDSKTFSLALMYHLVSIFPRALEYGICLFLTPFLHSSCTMVSGDVMLRRNPLHFPNSQSLPVTLRWPLCFKALSLRVLCERVRQ